MLNPQFWCNNKATDSSRRWLLSAEGSDAIGEPSRLPIKESTNTPGSKKSPYYHRSWLKCLCQRNKHRKLESS